MRNFDLFGTAIRIGPVAAVPLWRAFLLCRSSSSKSSAASSASVLARRAVGIRLILIGVANDCRSSPCFAPNSICRSRPIDVFLSLDQVTRRSRTIRKSSRSVWQSCGSSDCFGAVRDLLEAVGSTSMISGFCRRMIAVPDTRRAVVPSAQHEMEYL